MKDSRFPKTGSKEFNVQYFTTGQNSLSYKYPPTNKILETLVHKEDSENEIYINHFFLDLRKSFFIFRLVNQNFKEYEEYAAKFNLPAKKGDELKIYNIFLKDGFSSEEDKARFLLQIVHLSDSHIENMPLIKTMVFE